MPILKLSYDHLSIELRQCFAYCSLYPKDWRYDKNDLIQLWMAQGYLECQNENQCLEDVGDQYVHILLMRSFFQDVEMNKFGELEYFKMHDLMHDLTLSVAGSDCCLYSEKRKTIASPMHVSFEEYNPKCSLDMLEARRLRTILNIPNLRQDGPSNLLKFKCLRSLKLTGNHWIHVPKSIGEMKHLRYLDLSSCYKLTCLPKTLCNLVNLQTLKLNHCTKLEFSFEGLTKLINLRHLEIDGCKAFEGGMPVRLDRLTALQSLSNFIVGNDIDNGRKNAKLNELKELDLRNELNIENLSLVRDVERESKEINLKAKKCLKFLKLSWGYNLEVKNSDSLQLLENLCPYPSLKQLEVQDYPGLRFSGWISSLANLVELNIYRCRNCQHLPALEGLVSLKTPKIWDMDTLEYICYNGCSSSTAGDTTFFPLLEHLELGGCKIFRGWQRAANVNDIIDNVNSHLSLPQFLRLSYLEIKSCPNLSCMPTFPNLVEGLRLSYCSTKPLIDTLEVSTTESSATEELHPSLSKLQFLDLEMDIETLPEKWMQNLTSLKCLYICELSSLAIVFHHIRHLPVTLEELAIYNCDNLDSWSGDEDFNEQYQALHCLHSLQRIYIHHSESSESLPKWICFLQSLQLIRIAPCPNLKSLPEGMRRLTNLETLSFPHAPLLAERCKRGTGEEWPKIAHIPYIVVDGHRI